MVTIHLHLGDGRNGDPDWYATFDGDTDMPTGIPLPLPYTRQAAELLVAAEMARRFPGARIVVGK